MELIVQKREIFGKKNKSLRKTGLIPAELYGHGLENLHLGVSAKEFSRLFKEAGENTVIKLKVGEKEFNVLIHDIDKNAFTDEISHIDFYSVKMNEKIRARIPLEFVGESTAIREKGGILVKAMHEIEVEALPGDLPHNFQVDINAISDIGASVFVKDLKISKEVKVLVAPETVIATVTEMAKEEEIPAGPAGVEEVKVETEEKKELREKEKETEEKTK
ncbi:MAG: 50S ribosomal protein L25 [Candidatus Wolfebacteria bacterium GW2011_GWA1_44_24]|uniref:Large ribosomal subunit protein bL25 n=1 Tax=Candidatus Wolfebacteria bacterium GW2011_GWB1_41_12 TaxID=1619006 RepID=A0A0G0UNP3_9BACT|nr:MAG: 50S ribosomal protein L25 [Candidatus Wolfebacteria bacterium GW2011_GWB1_41_12]KKT56621.1 MAG: 50S ribosomal protein L25 [Candidatus Wolfebacteria bacterium GW2011_GWA1_44_24]